MPLEEGLRVHHTSAGLRRVGGQRNVEGMRMVQGALGRPGLLMGRTKPPQTPGSSQRSDLMLLPEARRSGPRQRFAHASLPTLLQDQNWDFRGQDQLGISEGKE